MTTLDDLIARLSAATGASRELDAEIAVAVDDRPEWAKTGTLMVHPEKAGAVLCGGRWSPSFIAPAYTGSLDAAMTLVPEGWTWLVRGPIDRSTSNRHDCYAHLDRNLEQHGEAFAATPALALTIAALKARKARP